MGTALQPLREYYPGAAEVRQVVVQHTPIHKVRTRRDRRCEVRCRSSVYTEP